MTTRRTSFDKLQRERAKRAKAAGKRERRQERSAEESEPNEAIDIPAGETLSAGELMQRLEVLHNRFEANRIDFDTFEEQKRELLERLAALPLD
jgi:hypothetical protein